MQSNNEKRRLEELENGIAAMEEEIKSIKAAMNDIAKAADYVFLQEMGSKLSEKEAVLEKQYELWQELAQQV